MTDFQKNVNELNDIIDSAMKEKQRLVVSNYRIQLIASFNQLIYQNSNVRNIPEAYLKCLDETNILLRSICNCIETDEFNSCCAKFEDNTSKLKTLLKEQDALLNSFVVRGQMLMICTKGENDVGFA